MSLTQGESDLFFVSAEERGMRLDKLLSQRFEEKSRTYFQYLIEEGCVFLNGKRVKKRTLVSENDEIELFFLATPGLSLEPENIPLDILYEDEDLLIINKPAGMVVHPAPGHWTNTFVHALLYHCKDLVLSQENIRPGIVHRLDKETSGLLLAAKTEKAHQQLILQFHDRKMQKEYLALTHGKTPPQTLSLPMGRHPVKRKEMCILSDGKEAITQFERLDYQQSVSLVLARPKTGRTHQIRVHLKHLSTPILGDVLYGKKSSLSSRQMLHAYQLSFSHPITQMPMKVQAPLPEDMKKLIEELNLSLEWLNHC
jgi:23S rRNA pseudouridine1911/1915/1917 synthase